MFDQADDPGFVFFPVDIAFFIRCELEDRKRRKKEGGGRVVPSADEYKRHQAEQGHVPATAKGGLYFRCFLQEYMHVGTGFSARQAFGDPVVYHGAPFGAFRRAFAAISTPRVDAMSFTVTQQLSLLKNLYFMQEAVEVLGLKDDDLNPPVPRGPYAPHLNLPPSFDNTSQRFSAPAMPSQFTAMGPSQYARQLAAPVANNHSSNDNTSCLPAMPTSPSYCACNPPVRATDTWNEVQPGVEKLEEYEAIESDELRQAPFNKTIHCLKEKEEDADRDHRTQDHYHGSQRGDYYSHNHQFYRGERCRTSSHLSHSPEPDAYEVDCCKTQANHEHSCKVSGFPPSCDRRKDQDRKQDHDRDRYRERDRVGEHNRGRDWDRERSASPYDRRDRDPNQRENNVYSQYLQIAPKPQSALMQAKPTLTLNLTPTSTPAPVAAPASPDLSTRSSAPTPIARHVSLLESSTKSGHRGDSSTESFPIGHPPIEEEFILGPELTTNDIIQRYRPVIEASTLVL